MVLLTLALLTSMGIALLFVAEVDQKINVIDHDVKRVFYGAEAALESGRESLRAWNLASGTLDLSDELARAAGANNAIDVDPRNIQPIVNAGGNLTGFSNVGDDEPLHGIQAFEGGWTAAYLMNDPGEGRTNLADADKRLTVIGVSYSADGSFEKVEAIVYNGDLVPTPPATIAVLGPDPAFQGGSSAAKLLTGNDCNGAGIPGYSVPVIGVVGSSAELLAEAGVDQPSTYVEGSETGTDTVDDIDGTIDARWTDCQELRTLAARVRDIADVVGNDSTPRSDLGTVGNPKVVFIDDDYDIVGNFSGAGVLWVTGKLNVGGMFAWQGAIFAVGRGEFERDGGGSANISGGTIVANISGPDQVLWSSDDCSGPDGISGNADDGLAEGTYWVNGSGAGDTVYCTSHLLDLPLRWPFDLSDFRQR